MPHSDVDWCLHYRLYTPVFQKTIDNVTYSMRQIYRKNTRISDYFTGGVMELKETLLQTYVGTQTWLAFYLCLSADIIVSHYFGALFCISNINKLQINTLRLHERNKMELRLECHCLSDFDKDLIIEDRNIVLMKIRI